MTDSPIKAVIFDVANVIVDWDPRLPLDGHVSEDKIDEFLKHAGMSAEVIAKFAEEKIDLDQLINHISESDLSDFGVEKRGDRLRLASAIEARKKELELCL